MYYLNIPQTSINVANNANVTRSLVTFHGAADLPTLLVNKIQTGIIEEGPYDGPTDISAARDFSSEATINDEICY